MEKISELLKEAKPLYFQKKRRAAQVKTVCSAAFIFFISVFSFTNIIQKAEYNELAAADFSIIEEYGLPVDDYGLFKVN